MVQESIYKSVAIVGAGPAGCICAKFLNDAGFNVTLFDKGKFLRTLLPTGGGKCNIAPTIFEYRELAQNYPRGEKFLYSLFTKFGVYDTLEFFKSIGVETYTRQDGRIFPISNSSKVVREKFLKSLAGVKFINEEVLKIIPNTTQSAKETQTYYIYTANNTYRVYSAVIATGGHAGVNLVKDLSINIIPQTQSLVGLVTKQDYSSLAGVSIKNVCYKNYKGDILFTHKGLSGPLIYKISSINAKLKFPYSINLELVKIENLQDELNKNPKKEIKNLLAKYLPKSFIIKFLSDLDIDENLKCAGIKGSLRDKITNNLKNYSIEVIGKVPDGEVVTCGGVDLNEINAKTLESKKYSNMYFCGEILDIDGFCGGFNLQNCWTTGYVAASSIINLF